MKTRLIAALTLSMAMIVAPGKASAQTWTPGTEIVGQSVQVDTQGVVNTVYFDQGGVARITSAAGKSAQGRWSVANEQLCLDVGAGSAECWPYRSAFQTGKPVTLTSNCNVTSQWTANNTNIPERQIAPERG